MQRSLLALCLLSLFLVATARTFNCPTFSPTSRSCSIPNNAGYTKSSFVPTELYPTTTPGLISICQITDLPSNLAQTVTDLFPEQKHPDPSMLRSDIFVYFTQDKSNLSFTFVQSVAGNVNRLGYAKYNQATQTTSYTRVAFPRTNSIYSSVQGCMQLGDTYKFGTFNNGDLVTFYMDPDQKSSSRWWSYIDAPTVGTGLTNPDDPSGTGCAANHGCVHSAWVYLTNEDITLFGFEDSSMGDADYNDLVFFLQIEGGGDFNEVPDYDGGNIRVCNHDTAVTSDSYATINCTQWGLLESTNSQSCLTFMSIPDGWIWASNDDQSAKSAISALASKWSYTNANCFLLSITNTTGAGYRPNGSPCLASEYNITTYLNGTKTCYNAKCTARFVLKGQALGVGCSAENVCTSTSPGVLLASEPSDPSSVTVFPTVASVYLRTGDGSVDVSSSINLPGGASSTQKIDIVVLADFVVPTGTKRSQVSTSWNNIQTGFSSEKLDARFAYVSYKRQSSTTYTLTTDYTFRTTPNALTDADWTGTSCSSGTNPLLKAATEVINTRYSNFNWRETDAFHAIWIVSGCPIGTSDQQDFYDAVIKSGVIPIITYNGAWTNGNYPAGYSLSPAPPLYKLYRANSDWSAPFTYASSTQSTPKGAGAFKSLPTSLIAYATDGYTNFVSGLSTSVNTDAASTGAGVTSYKITWPSGLTPDPTVSYTTKVRVMGRTATEYRITYNRAPVLPDASYTFRGNVNQNIALNPTDADGNLLTLTILTVPNPTTQGKLYTMDGVQITAGTTLPRTTYNFYFTPVPYAQGTFEFNVRVSDGCATDDGKVSLTVQYANNPPEADDIVIEMTEDQAAAGVIDFAGKIRDVDNTNGLNNQGQTLTIRILSVPTPSGKGTLRTTTGATQSVGTIGSGSSTELRFPLTTPRSGYGTVTFTYQVSDGTNQGNDLSRVATVTINIAHVNHAPILNIPNTRYSIRIADTTAPISIAGTIVDYDSPALDDVNLYIVTGNTNLSQFSVGADFMAPGTYDLKLYNNDLTSTTSTFTLSGLKWAIPSTNNRIETVTFRARDTQGAWSNAVDVTFITADTKPPRWTGIPTSPQSIMQGSRLNSLFFAATDDDAGQGSTLTFRMVQSPSNGVVYIRPLTGGQGTSAIALNTPFTPNGNTVGANMTHSYYTIDYLPTSTFYGQDIFSFTVTDSEGVTAATAATVTVNVDRMKIAPNTANVTISMLEEQPGSADIPLVSNNIPTNSLLLRLESLNFLGSLKIGGVDWSVGQNTSLATGAITVTAQAGLGIFGSPAGTFSYTVFEPATDLKGDTRYGTINIEHVNHPPTSANRQFTVAKRTLLKGTLTAFDIDAGDTTDTLRITVTSIDASSKGSFFFDEQMTDPLTPQTLKDLTDRTFYYLSNTEWSSNGLPLASFKFVVTDQSGLRSVSEYTASVIVTTAGDVPIPGVLDTYTYQETPVPMILADGVITETGGAPIVRLLTQPPAATKGSFAVCDASGVCGPVADSSLPRVITSTTGRVVFVPRDYDWGMNFTSFNFELEDAISGAKATYTMRIHVIHVNKRPTIKAENFMTTAESSQGIIINESNWRSFDWTVSDVDTLPANLQTSLRVAFYTSQGFSMYSCVVTNGHWNSSQCSFNPQADTPLAIRADFAKNARKLISSYETVTTDCSTADQLKARLGAPSALCSAHFKMVFAPTPLASFTPYVTITFVGVDDEEAESQPIAALIFVKALNSPPTVWSPSVVLAGQGVNNPFIRDTAQDSNTFNNPVSVDDVDSNGNIELLTISVNPGYSGNLVWPETAPCVVDDSNNQVWYCRDRIASFNQWLTDLRFEVTSNDRADITFTMNDLGFSSDYKPSANLTASSVTSVRLTAAVAAPKGNSSTLAIAVGVAAGVGLLLLGALGFFLRRAVAPPSDDYFSAATSPLSAAPTSPLYTAQNQQYTSAIYKAPTN